MKKHKKTFDLRLGKQNMTYTIEEITELLGVTKGTVYRWLREGLAPIDRQIPYLIKGKNLKDFLKQRQLNRKWQCKINELPCFKCQRPRRALEDKAWIQFSKKSHVNLSAHCEVCQRKMFKCVSAKQLSEIRNYLCIEELQVSHILGSKIGTCSDSKDYATLTQPLQGDINQLVCTQSCATDRASFGGI